MANDIVFAMKFNTKNGEDAIRRFATQAQMQLSKALSLGPMTRGLSEALGIEKAVSNVSKLQTVMEKLNRTIFGGMSAKSSMRTGQRVPFLGLNEQDIHARMEAFRDERIRGRYDRISNPQGRIQLRDEKGNFTKNWVSAGGQPITDKKKLTDDEIIRFNEHELSLRKNQINQIQRSAEAIAKADKMRLEARRLEAKAIMGSATRAELATLNMKSNRVGDFGDIAGLTKEGRERVIDERKRAALAFASAKKAGTTVEGETYEDFMPGVRRTKRDAERKRVTDAKREAASISASERGFVDKRIDAERRHVEARQGRVASHRTIESGLPFSEIASAEKRHSRKFNIETAREFATGGHGTPTFMQRMMGKQQQTYDEFHRGKVRTGSRRLNAEQALGISPTATRLLALSSVLAPLNATLGAVVMQAGFAAFSLGAPAAALSLLATAASTTARILRNSVESSKKAGLETAKWNGATTRLAVQMEAFQNTLGVKTQLAFAKSIDGVTNLTKLITDLPWDSMVDSLARTSEAILSFTDVLADAYNRATFIPRKVGDVSSWLGNKAEDAMGLKGRQRVKLDVWDSAPGFLSQLVEEFTEMFGKHTGPESDPFGGFVHTPKFAFNSVEGIGKSIQQSILKQYEKDPTARALDMLNDSMRQELSKLDSVDKSLKVIVDRNTRNIPTLE